MWGLILGLLPGSFYDSRHLEEYALCPFSRDRDSSSKEVSLSLAVLIKISLGAALIASYLDRHQIVRSNGENN